MNYVNCIGCSHNHQLEKMQPGESDPGIVQNLRNSGIIMDMLFPYKLSVIPDEE